jgi:hypothetical protein
MSRLIGDTLPAEIVAALDGRELERKIGPAHLLLTRDADGTPRPCMLSAGEVLAVDERRLRFALWADSRTTANLADGGPAVVCYVAPGSVIYVRGATRPLDAPNEDRLRCFELVVDSVEADEHRGFPITSGISFEVASGEPGEMLETWRRQLELLRGH